MVVESSSQQSRVNVDVQPEVVCATWLKAWEDQRWGTMATLSRTIERMSEADCIRGLQQTLAGYNLLMPQAVSLVVVNKTATTIEYMLKNAALNKVIVNFCVSVVRERGLWFVDPATVKASR